MGFRFKNLSSIWISFVFSIFSEYFHSSVVQAILVHRSLHVLHVLLEHICGVENRFEARYIYSLFLYSPMFFLLKIITFSINHCL